MGLASTSNLTIPSSAALTFDHTAWCPCDSISIPPGADYMITAAGSHIRLEDIEFDDLGKGFAAKWCFKAPSSLQQATPQQEEVILISNKAAEAGLLSLGQETGCSWAEHRISDKKAFLLKAQKAPITSKLLELTYLSLSNFIHMGTQAKIKEVASPSALNPCKDEDENWKGILAALYSPRLERNAAREIFKDDSLHQGWANYGPRLRWVLCGPCKCTGN